jgi:hypothetical protein
VTDSASAQRQGEISSKRIDFGVAERALCDRVDQKRSICVPLDALENL